MDEFVVTFRACVTSSKGGLPLSDVNKDYRSVEGENIPYRKLGFSSLEELIKNVPGLRRFRKGSVEWVECLPDDKSAHLVELINKQRPSKKKPSRMNMGRRPTLNNRNNFMNNPRPFQRSQNFPPRTRIQSPKKSPPLPQKIHDPSTMPVTTYPPSCVAQEAPEQMSPSSRMQKNHLEAQQRIQATKNQQQKPQAVSSPVPGVQVTNGNMQKAKSPPQTPVNTSTNTRNIMTPPTTPKTPTSSFNMNSIKDSLNTVKITNNSSPQTPINLQHCNLPPLVIKQNVNGNSKSPVSSAPSHQSVKGLPPLKVARPLSERLKRPSPERQQDTNDRRVTFSPDVKICNLPNYPSPPTPPPEKNEEDPRLILMTMAKKLHLPEPEYKKVINTSKNGKVAIFSSVSIGPKHKYSSYPFEAQNDVEAEKLAATAALNGLHTLHGPPIKMRITAERDVIQQRLIAIVEVHPSGVFVEQLSVYYKDKHDEELPSDWMSIIEQSEEVTLEKGVENSLIVSMRNPEIEKAKTPPISPRIERPFFIRPPEAHPPTLVLPTDYLWPVHVLHVTSTTEIWIRVIQDEYYEDKLLNMYDEMSQYYSNITVPASSVEILNYYVIKVDDQYHRVHVEAIDPLTGNAEIFYIDTGEGEIVECSKLYSLEKRFCDIPAQAIRACLSGLEDIAVCDTITGIAEELLLGKSFFLNVLSRDKDEISHVVVGVFYDTNTEFDVNVNDKIIQELYTIMEISQLDVQLSIKGRVLEAYLSHIEQNGDVYLQVKNDGIVILTSMLNALLETAINDENIIKKATVTGPLNSSEIYLAQRPDNNWVRVRVAVANSSSKKMNMIDFGGIIDVDKCKLLRLSDLSVIISKFPAQATKVELHNVGKTNFTARMATRLSELASPCELLVCKIVQAAEFGRPSTVELFKRSQPDNLLISINNTLELEPELSKTNGDGNNNVKMRKRLDRTNSRGSGGDEAAKCLRKPKIPAIGNFFDVHVTNLPANPTNFVVQPYDDKPDLESLMKNLQEVYNANDGPKLHLDSLKEGRIYAAKNHDGYWYRACVNQVMDEHSVAVYLCDFGNIIVITMNQLQLLKKEFLELPYQAIKAKLYGIQPTNGDWSLQTCLRFQKLVVNKSFVSVIKDIEADDLMPGGMTIGIELIDVSDPTQDIYIHKILIEEKRAVPVTR